MTPPRTLEAWIANSREVRVVRPDGDTYALHAGRGSYMQLSAADLGGANPSNGQMIPVSAHAIAQESGSQRQVDHAHAR